MVWHLKTDHTGSQLVRPPTVGRATGEVFADPSGRRWRFVKLGIAVLIAAIGALFAVSWGPVHASPELAPNERPPPLPPAGNVGDPPVIRNGPLVRLVRVENRHGQGVAVDPLTGTVVTVLNAADAGTVGTSKYAIFRYGYDQGVHKTISLTFDDGPDQVWTPQILDLLSRQKVPATFFIIGSEAVRHPALVQREVREGHAIGNHTMTHPELTVPMVQQELIPTDRILSAVAGVRTALFRLPYDGSGPSGHNSEPSVMLAVQRQGYIISTPDFDTNDWQYGLASTRPSTPIPLPPTTMDNITILLHDGGGNRAATVAYLNRLIPWARDHGYTFHSLPQVSADVRDRTTHGAPNLWDRETIWSYQALWIFPGALLRLLFWIAVVTVVGGGMINVFLAFVREFADRRAARVPTDGEPPRVSVVIPAFNESALIGDCLRALRQTRYGNLIEVIVVDDGSVDDTAAIVNAMAAQDKRIRLIRKANGGKPSALNRGFVEARGDVVVTLDADTMSTPTTVEHLVRPFAHDPDERLAAVAGTVKVGNLRNVVTWWQALEYIMQVGVDRSAQDALHAIVVVPGACAGWRRAAVLRVGGYSGETLAEDCDLSLQLQRRGYRVVQSSRAVAFTEAPESVRQLSRQRFRWTFGNAQALWKHRSMVFNPRYRWLGAFSMPSAALSILLPIVFLPAVYVATAFAIAQRHGMLLLAYAAIFLAAQFIQAAAGVALTRERRIYLLIVPIYRLIAEPLRAYLLYKAALTVLRGTGSRWHKVTRKGSVSVPERISVEARQ